MKDYTKLVEALRICHVVDCDDCVLKKECVESIIKGERPYVLLHNDAADAIEELLKVNRERTELYEDAVKQMPKRGKWVGVSPMVDTVQCSVCGGQLFSAELETPYCPYCGAKMEVQE